MNPLGCQIAQNGFSASLLSQGKISNGFYTVSLEFFEGPNRTGDYVLFASDIDITQKLGNNTKNDYRTKLIVYLASRLRWDSPQDGQYLTISKQYLFKNLDLLGSNSSRNNQIFWRTVEKLRQEGYILGAQELPGKRKMPTVQFQINPDKMRSNVNVAV